MFLKKNDPRMIQFVNFASLLTLLIPPLTFFCVGSVKVEEAFALTAFIAILGYILPILFFIVKDIGKTKYFSKILILGYMLILLYFQAYIRIFLVLIVFLTLKIWNMNVNSPNFKTHVSDYEIIQAHYLNDLPFGYSWGFINQAIPFLFLLNYVGWVNYDNQINTLLLVWLMCGFLYETLALYAIINWMNPLVWNSLTKFAPLLPIIGIAGTGLGYVGSNATNPASEPQFGAISHQIQRWQHGYAWDATKDSNAFNRIVSNNLVEDPLLLCHSGTDVLDPVKVHNRLVLTDKSYGGKFYKKI